MRRRITPQSWPYECQPLRSSHRTRGKWRFVGWSRMLANARLRREVGILALERSLEHTAAHPASKVARPLIAVVLELARLQRFPRVMVCAHKVPALCDVKIAHSSIDRNETRRAPSHHRLSCVHVLQKLEKRARQRREFIGAQRLGAFGMIKAISISAVTGALTLWNGFALQGATLLPPCPVQDRGGPLSVFAKQLAPRGHEHASTRV